MSDREKSYKTSVQILIWAFKAFLVALAGILIAAALTGCEKDETCLCTRYTKIITEAGTEWEIKDTPCQEVEEGTDDQGRYFYVVCSPNFKLKDGCAPVTGQVTEDGQQIWIICP